MLLSAKVENYTPYHFLNVFNYNEWRLQKDFLGNYFTYIAPYIYI